MLQAIESKEPRIQEILSKLDPGESLEYTTKIVGEFYDTFALSKRELGKTPLAKHHIRMQQGILPVRHGPYRCSPKELEFMLKECGMLEELGCIERCEVNWAMPVIMVKKKDTTDLRMCIDFRALNKNMLVENYPIPRIDDILSTLGKGKYFTVLDLKSGFW